MNNAKSALMLYAIELNKAGYNTRSIQDSVMCLALDVVLKE
ncbi:MAG: hypothetical protein PHC39_04645 [Proteiniphilum sp.]|nr:hypothetical protein [Proteiniphilum sp.]